MNAVLKLLRRLGVQAKMHQIGECTALVAKEDGRVHISISHASRLPTYEELKEARYTLAPAVPYMAQIFPPKAEFVNVHQYTLHLWELPEYE